MADIPLRQHLYLMRHAHALGQGTARSDFERSLSPRGQHEAAEAAVWIAAQQPKPEKIVASTAARTGETAAIVMAAVGLTGIQWLPALYHAELDAWIRLVERHLDGRPLLLIGHNPVMEQGTRHLLAPDTSEQRPGYFATAAVVHLTVPAGEGLIAGAGGLVAAFQPPAGSA